MSAAPPVQAVRVLASTTSHKRESLAQTLEVFGRLGLNDVDLNLHHLIETGVTARSVVAAADAAAVRIRAVSGGWCDFFHEGAEAQKTDQSVDRQVMIAAELGARILRLFFGRLDRPEYSPVHLDVVSRNLLRLSDRHPEMLFVFENHDGASLRPEMCGEVLQRVDRENIRMNFDPINFERAGVDSLAALSLLRRYVRHVHLKGLERGEFCEFGAGDVDLGPFVASLLGQCYSGLFTVEYEGPFDGTLRLYQSVQRARLVLQELSPAAR